MFASRKNSVSACALFSSGAFGSGVAISFASVCCDSVVTLGLLEVVSASSITSCRFLGNVNWSSTGFLGLDGSLVSCDFLDVGSFLVTGPLGLIANQVANLGKAGLTATSGETRLQSVHLESAFDQGVMQTRYVALATDKFRVAFDGQFNLVEQHTPTSSSTMEKLMLGLVFQRLIRHLVLTAMFLKIA